MYINVKECQQSNDRAIKTRKTQCKSPGGKTVHALLDKVAEQENGGSIVWIECRHDGFDDDGDIHWTSILAWDWRVQIKLAMNERSRRMWIELIWHFIILHTLIGFHKPWTFNNLMEI